MSDDNNQIPGTESLRRNQQSSPNVDNSRIPGSESLRRDQSSDSIEDISPPSKEVNDFWTTWVIRILIGIVVFFILLGIFFYVIRPDIHTVSPQTYQIQYSPFAFWGPSVPSDIPTRNTCKLYQFEAVRDNTIDPVSDVYHVIPAQTSMDLDTLDSLNDEIAPSCYDTDQQLAVRAAHACIRLQDVQDGDYNGQDATGNDAGSFCFTSTGDQVAPGQQEQFYSTSVTYVNNDGTSELAACSQPPCNGSIGVLGLRYRVVDQTTGDSVQPVDDADGGGMKCLSLDGDGVTIIATTCDATDQSQILRFSRAPYNTPIIGGPDQKQGTYGNTLQISDRNSGTYLNYDSDAESLVFNGDVGFNWALYNRMTGSTSGVSSVQQIVYIGDLTSDQKDQLFAQKLPDNIFSTISSLGLLSMTLLENPGSEYGIGMTPFATYPTGDRTNADDAPAGNLLDVNLFNNIAFGTNLVPF